MNKNLASVKYVGPAMQQRLEAHGINSLEQLAGLSEAELAAIPGIGLNTAPLILMSARALVAESVDTDPETPDVVEAGSAPVEPVAAGDEMPVTVAEVKAEPEASAPVGGEEPSTMQAEVQAEPSAEPTPDAEVDEAADPEDGAGEEDRKAAKKAKKKAKKAAKKARKALKKELKAAGKAVKKAQKAEKKAAKKAKDD